MLSELKQRLIVLADRVLGDLSLELVDLELEFSGKRRCLRFFVDRPDGGVNIDECAGASRALGWELEEDESIITGPFVLEVSSPGVERRVGRPRDFKRFVGHSLKLKLGEPIEGRRNYIGRLSDADDLGFSVTTIDAGKLRLDYGQVARANLIDVEVEGEKDGDRSS
jgi:ribosome maturation factor RimP